MIKIKLTEKFYTFDDLSDGDIFHFNKGENTVWQKYDDSYAREFVSTCAPRASLINVDGDLKVYTCEVIKCL